MRSQNGQFHFIPPLVNWDLRKLLELVGGSGAPENCTLSPKEPQTTVGGGDPRGGAGSIYSVFQTLNPLVFCLFSHVSLKHPSFWGIPSMVCGCMGEKVQSLRGPLQTHS